MERLIQRYRKYQNDIKSIHEKLKETKNKILDLYHQLPDEVVLAQFLNSHTNSVANVKFDDIPSHLTRDDKYSVLKSNGFYCIYFSTPKSVVTVEKYPQTEYAHTYDHPEIPDYKIAVYSYDGIRKYVVDKLLGH